ncbi:MAG: DUF5916 domain-containing protein [Candidatus Korobacteraceae bacterium]
MALLRPTGIYRLFFSPVMLYAGLLFSFPFVCMAAPQGSQDVVAEQVPSERSSRSAMVTAITSRIAIDGLLDEEAWNTAPKIGGLIQREPRSGVEPSERTEVTLLHDADNLYIGVICYDSEPEKVIGTQMGRDAVLTSDDRISVVLDTYRDRRNGFYFSTNPAGALVDGLIFANGQSNAYWDGIWNVRARRTPQGWSAEFSIPFKSLNFPSGRTVWGFNFSRNIQRKLEENRWSGAEFRTLLFQVSEAGEITNLEGLSQGIGLNLRPFAGGRWLHTSANGDNRLIGKPGFDMFYNVLPSLKLTATVNTDFGETEVDARQINLSRFSVLFPEKRTFFLEDAGVFSFASTGIDPPPGVPNTGAEVIPFFSRQIGLLNGAEVPLDFGLKLTGKVGRTDIGFLNVRTREISLPDLPLVPRKDFFVGRVRRNLFRQSFIGGIYTEGNPALTSSSRTAGADLRLATTNFLGLSKNLIVDLYALKSMNEHIQTDDLSYGIAAQFPNDRYIAQFILREIPQGFQPGLGFVQRRNVRLMRVGASFNPRPKKLLNLQQMFHDVYYTRFTQLDNGLLASSQFYATMVDWHFRTGDSVHGVFDIDHSYERLFSPFTIFPGVVLPIGEYEFTRFRFNVVSAAKRRLQGSFATTFGEYWSGSANTFQTGITYKVPPRFTISLNTNQTFASLPQKNFVARIFSSQINYTATPFLTFYNLIQYDNQSRNLGWQSRVRWTLQPGNDLFIVFSQGWIQDPAARYEFVAQDRRLATKFQYTLRF